MHQDVSRLIRRLCVVAGFGLSARLAVPGNPVMALGTYLNRNAIPVSSSASSPPSTFVPYGPSHPGFAFPELPPAASAADGAHCGFEALCGAKLCTFQGVRHLAWSVPLLPSTYLLPSGFVHAMLFFGPAIFAPGSKVVIRRILAIGAFAIGPLFSMLFSATNASREGVVVKNADGETETRLGESAKLLQRLFPESLGFAAGNGYANTWPAWWCFMSAAQALLILVGDVLARDHVEGLTEREKNARKAAERKAAEAAAAVEATATAKGGGAAARKRQQMNLTASASLEHEYEVVVPPAPAAAAAPRGGSSRRRTPAAK